MSSIRGRQQLRLMPVKAQDPPGETRWGKEGSLPRTFAGFEDGAFSLNHQLLRGTPVEAGNGHPRVRTDLKNSVADREGVMQRPEHSVGHTAGVPRGPHVGEDDDEVMIAQVSDDIRATKRRRETLDQDPEDLGLHLHLGRTAPQMRNVDGRVDDADLQVGPASVPELKIELPDDSQRVEQPGLTACAHHLLSRHENPRPIEPFQVFFGRGRPSLNPDLPGTRTLVKL